MSVTPEPGDAPQPTLLCVDDEPNILSALRRLLRPAGYRVLTAESGAAGLAVLESEPVDLVISDMRMPEMDGARFLEHVRERWPDVTRMLLTGYSDVSSILAAINRGEISRYITKPWDDNDLLLIVRHAVERRQLEREKQALEAVVRRQNEELRALNAGLEAKVEERTRDLQEAHAQVVGANDKLKRTFVTSVKVFSSLIELRGGSLSGHTRRVADMARKMAVAMALPAREVQDIFVAGLLLDIGRIGFSDELLARPVSMMNGEQLAQFRRHPLRAQQLMMPLEDLGEAANMLAAQHERHDGQGFPHGLKGDAIPRGARILALASDFDNLQLGMLMPRKLSRQDAIGVVLDNSGKRYDPEAVLAFRAVMGLDIPVEDKDYALSSDQLEAGMVLTRDLVSREGFLLLSSDHVIDDLLINKIRDFERKTECRFTLYTNAPPGAPTPRPE